MIRRFADLAVESGVPFDLPETSGPPDIVVRPGEPGPAGVPLQPWPGGARGAATWLAISRAAAGYRVSLNDLECLVAFDGRTIVFAPSPPLDDAMLVHLLLHQVLPLAAGRTGRLVLHACGVETPAGTVAFLGQSGAGKSTLAAACCARGFLLVADDALVVDLSGAEAGVWPTADALRLWTDMRDAAPEPPPPVTRDAGKLRAAVTVSRARSRLARIYLLDTPSDTSVTLVDASPTAVRVEMLSHLFRLDVTDRDESRRLFDAVHRTASLVPARTLFYPNGIEHLGAAVDALVRDLSTSR